MDERLAGASSAIGSVMFIWAILCKYFSFNFNHYLSKNLNHLVALVYPYVQITFPEAATGHMKQQGEAYKLVEIFLSDSASRRANKLKAELGLDGSNKLKLSMDEHEEVTDEFERVRLWWSSFKTTRSSQSFSYWPADDEKRFYRLTFHRWHRELVIGRYLPRVIELAKEIKVMTRQRKLYTNNPSSKWHGYRSNLWSYILFEHPSTFDTLAMDPAMKEEIVADLDAFRNGKDYYLKIGKAWKRGYLLHGPPGTGKSTMIAAIANFLDYDIYDLELTTVKTNTELRKLFIETTNKSIIVIEDIDCSLDLSGKRKVSIKRKNKEDSSHDSDDEEDKDKSKVTLSGLLNFIDGLWSACGGERILIFTTNYIEKLDPALIRRGRMDKHIEMSYCCFDAFKVLAKNYLDIDSHPLFEAIQRKMEEVKITPADVAENLMPKSLNDGADSCLRSLIKALEAAKERSAYEDKDKTEEIVEEEI